MIIHAKSYPRAALIGNPSDGYYGKTIAFVFSNYCTEVQLYESPELNLLPSLRDTSVFDSVEHLVDDVRTYGYYGGIRLLKATIKKFHEYCSSQGYNLNDANFTVRYHTSIPNRLGLAGSSAIITACVRALMEFYDIDIPVPVLANLILSVEKEELGIPAGLQDRVAQAHETPVFMDFDKDYMDKHGFGIYKTIDLSRVPNLYVAYRTDLAEGSEIMHSNLREDYENGNPEVLAAIDEWRQLTDEAFECIQNGDCKKLGQLLDRNFDLRCEVSKAVSDKNKRMVELARSVGASAKFTGSGGAIIGTYGDDKMFEKLRDVLGKEEVQTIKPRIVDNGR